LAKTRCNGVQVDFWFATDGAYIAIITPRIIIAALT
jgi:hypothetical protein